MEKDDEEEIELSLLSVWDGKDADTSLLAEMHMRFADFEPPSAYGSAAAADFTLLVDLENEIQFLANARFGKDTVKFECVRIVRGSLVVFATLTTVGSAVYLFFKDYSKLREGVLAFVKDVKTASGELRKIVKRHLKPRHDPKGPARHHRKRGSGT